MAGVEGGVNQQIQALSDDFRLTDVAKKLWWGKESGGRPEKLAGFRLQMIVQTAGGSRGDTAALVTCLRLLAAALAALLQ